MNRELFISTARNLGIPLSDSQVDGFAAFEDALYEANKVMNLTRVPREECWLRHFIDSLLLARLLPSGASVLDIGSGPGFPGWPLACARPDLEVVTLDSSGKMFGFLQSRPLPNLRPLLGRAEDMNLAEGFDVVTGRAVAPLSIQLELSAASCKVDGFVIPMRTPNDVPAIQSFVGRGLGLELVRWEKAMLPGTDIERVFPIYKKVSRTDLRYPRSWADIRRAPLV